MSENGKTPTTEKPPKWKQPAQAPVAAPEPFRRVLRLGRLTSEPAAVSVCAVTPEETADWQRATKRTLSLASGVTPVSTEGFTLSLEDGEILVENPAGETGLLADNDACVILEG